MKYQQMNSVGSHRYELIRYKPMVFRTHMHRHLEFSYVLEGETEVTIRGKTETARQGDALFIFSNHIHSYATPVSSEVAVFIVSSDYVPQIATATHTMIADGYVFRPDPISSGFFIHNMIDNPAPSDLMITASIYTMFQCFQERRQLLPRDQADQQFFSKALLYIEERFREDISLNTLTRDLGYSYHYASRAFNYVIQMSFRQYLNLYRIDYAQTLLSGTDMPISKVALESGFQNIRSFNRAYGDMVGETPHQFRKRSQLGEIALHDNLPKHVRG